MATDQAKPLDKAKAPPPSQQTQDQWLKAAKRQRVAVVLRDGEVLVGTLLSWDWHTLEIAPADDGPSELVYKHAIERVRRSA